MPPYEEEKNWVMEIGEPKNNDETMIMIDSGFAHVCPLGCAKQLPLTPMKEKFSALTADGRPI
eukprot:10954515-Heterocapsa_arctica.AAC.1